MASKAEQSERTRRRLLEVGRDLFATQGYFDTSTEQIVQRAQVTRGALYYHFRDKADLFQGVYEAERTALVSFIGQRIQEAEGDLWQKTVVTASHAFIEKSVTPDVQRILFRDGPAVLPEEVIQGPESALNLIRMTFEQLMANGQLARLPLDLLAHVFLLVTIGLGLYITNKDSADIAQREALEVLEALLNGLRLDGRKRG